MKKSLISVIIPTYNRAKYIKKAIDSIYAQKYTPIEIIVVDDGSTDNTQEILQDYPDIKYFYQENQGVSSARNLALQESTGQYVAFLDSDDYWLPGKLEAQTKYFCENPDCQIVFTGYHNILSKDELQSMELVKHELSLEKRYKHYLPSALIKKEVFQKCGNFSKELLTGEDSEIVLRMQMRGININHYISENYYHRLLHGTNLILTLTPTKECKESFKNSILSNLREQIQNKHVAKKPLISVIIPTYNRASYIEKAINSVLAENYEPIEIIVVDDGSTDNTKEIIQKKYPFIKYFYQENRGPSEARNTGIKNALGEYISLLDSDDYWLPGKLAAQLKYFRENPECLIVFTGYSNILEKEELKENDLVQHELLLEKTLKQLLPTALIKKEVFQKVGLFSKELFVAEDTELIIRMCVNGIKTDHYLSENYYHRLLHDQNLILTSKKGITDSKEINKITLSNIRQKIQNKYTQQTPVISIIIPVKDGEKYLKEALDSITTQQDSNCEIIVVDDLSVDQSAEIAIQAGVKVIKLSEHAGPPKARNIGLKEAQGQFIMFHDADDILIDGCLRSFQKIFQEHPETEMVFAKRQDFISPELIENNDISLKSEAYFGGLAGCALIKRTVFDKVGFFDENILAGDAISWQLKARDLDIKSKNIPEITVYRRLHQNNFSQTHKQNNFKDFASILRQRIKK
ncbi:glycosyltransferase family 2 protein [Selenomonadales bacterium OttesenSCG-928-I06]|nr:glycosyltransferase family 2 protein [Selenomonadales bacterium OttesenSCG-928-I06]